MLAIKYNKIVISALVALLSVSGCATWCAKDTGDGDPNYLKLLACSLVTPKPKPPAEVAYVVTEGQRIEKVARSVSFDMTPARDGTAALEDVPVWAYVGTDPAAWNGGNHVGTALSVRVKANNAGSYELKVGPTPNGVQEPDVQAPCKAGVKVSMKLELLEDGVNLTANGKSAFVEVPIAGDYTLGLGWPISKRQGCLGAKLTNIVWGF